MSRRQKPDALTLLRVETENLVGRLKRCWDCSICHTLHCRVYQQRVLMSESLHKCSTASRGSHQQRQHQTSGFSPRPAQASQAAFGVPAGSKRICYAVGCRSLYVARVVSRQLLLNGIPEHQKPANSGAWFAAGMAGLRLHTFPVQDHALEFSIRLCFMPLAPWLRCFQGRKHDRLDSKGRD